MDKFLKYLMLLLVTTLSLTFTACGGDDDEPNLFNPDEVIQDPTGTISISMRNNNLTSLDGLQIGADDNFHGDGWMFSDLGKMNGIGNINNIPENGWASKVSVNSNHGYVACRRLNNGNTTSYVFYRIFVTDYLYAAETEGVIGAQVKYLKDFKGLDQEIIIDASNTIFDGEGGTHTIWFKNKSITLFDIEVSEPWCTAKKVSSNNEPFLYNGIEISVPKMNSSPKKCTVKLRTAYNKECVVNVEYKGFEPLIKIGDTDELSFVPWEGKSYDIPIESNCKETLLFSNPSWTKVSLHENQLTIFVYENPEREKREDNIIIQSSIGLNEDIKINVVQDWHKYINNAYGDCIREFDSNPGTGNHYQFRFNTSYHPGELDCFTDFSDNNEWFTVRFRWNGANGYSDGWVDIENVAINNTGNTRSAKVILQSNDGENSLIYTIIQK